jgi:hypothetical protein
MFKVQFYLILSLLLFSREEKKLKNKKMKRRNSKRLFPRQTRHSGCAVSGLSWC